MKHQHCGTRNPWLMPMWAGLALMWAFQIPQWFTHGFAWRFVFALWCVSLAAWLAVLGCLIWWARRHSPTTMYRTWRP